MKRFTARFFLLALLIANTISFAEEGPESSARRGLEAFSHGRYDLARLFLSEAYHQAVLQNDDGKVQAVLLNCADVELELRRPLQALSHLARAGKPVNAHYAILLGWKRAQAWHQQGESDLGFQLLDSLLENTPHVKEEALIRIDRLAMGLEAGKVSNPLESIRQLETTLSSELIGQIYPIQALAQEKAGQESQAADTWVLAALAYGKAHRHVSQAQSMVRAAALMVTQGREGEGRLMALRASEMLERFGLRELGSVARALSVSPDAAALANPALERDFLSNHASKSPLPVLDSPDSLEPPAAHPADASR